MQFSKLKFEGTVQESYLELIAFTPFKTKYRVITRNNSIEAHYKPSSSLLYIIQTSCKDVEEAIKVCQEDFEKRIIGCLE